MVEVGKIKAAWDREVLASPGLDVAGCERLRVWQIQHGCSFGERPLCGVLRPEFVSRRRLHELATICTDVRGAIRKVRRLLQRGQHWTDRLDLSPEASRLVQIEPGYEQLGITSRLDAFEVGEELNFVELNAEAPAGIAYHDVLAGLFQTLPPMRTLGARLHFRPLNMVSRLLGALLTTWVDWGGSGKPRIAIVDWRESPTRSEFRLLAIAFGRAGYPAVVVDPRDLDHHAGRLIHRGKRIDLVYRRVLFQDCIDRPDDVAQLVDAVAHRSACMVNPFRAAILHRKRLFAHLTDPVAGLHLSREEQGAVDRHVPWTRLVQEGWTEGPGALGRVDLLPFARRLQPQLVLKPDSDHGGKGVLLGWSCNAAEWDTALDRALIVPHVIQWRVPLRRERFPLMDGSRRTQEFLVDRDPYLFRGRMGGFLTRLAAGPLANVSAGGGMVPTFLVQER